MVAGVEVYEVADDADLSGGLLQRVLGKVPGAGTALNYPARELRLGGKP
jgi:hypothetical protein